MRATVAKARPRRVLERDVMSGDANYRQTRHPLAGVGWTRELRLLCRGSLHAAFLSAVVGGC